MAPTIEIDVLENRLRRTSDLLDILLIDRTTGKNLLWATDSYQNNGKSFALKDRMKPELVTGVYGKLIQPRAAKSREEQLRRTKVKGEVFTPLKIVAQMNKLIDWAGKYPTYNDNWQDYVKELKLEITCGEAPFIVGRYNSEAHTGAKIQIYHKDGAPNRGGFLDRKLYVVDKYCVAHKQWVFWAKEAYKASYGYEWQGDNVLIARENLLYTFIDFYIHKFGRKPNIKLQTEIAEIISWNIFQMDGIRYVVPASCHHETKTILGQPTLLDGILPDVVEKYECEGCKYNRPTKHNGRYVRIMDWETKKPQRFIDLF